jgi:hypothetical protein
MYLKIKITILLDKFIKKIAKQRVAERRSNNVPHISYVLSNTAPLFLRPTSHCSPSLYSQTLTAFPNIIEKWELCNFWQKQISNSCKLR